LPCLRKWFIFVNPVAVFVEKQISQTYGEGTKLPFVAAIFLAERLVPETTGPQASGLPFQDTAEALIYEGKL
jgi:hypothetical protein